MIDYLRMNEHITNYSLKDYGDDEPEGVINLDCSLGVNPVPPANSVFSRLQNFSSYSEIKSYPHDDSIKDALCKWFGKNGLSRLKRENFILGNGSYDILCHLNLLCLTNGKRVLGHAPQFTAYVDHVFCIGAQYDAYYLKKETNFLFDVSEYINHMGIQHDLFIVENPNNPTGQTLLLSEIELIAKKAFNQKTILIVDEAYGDYMPFSNSAVNLIFNYPNVIVTRTFSKGFGLAGIRFGYAVSAATSQGRNSTEENYNILNQLKKSLHPFNCNGIARFLALATLDAVMDDIPYDPFRLQVIKEEKLKVLAAFSRLNKAFGRTLKVAQTFDFTPIMSLYYDDADENFDLQKHFMKFGILTVSCANYMGLDRRMVRMMLPQPCFIPLLLELLEKAISALPARDTGL